MNGLLDCQTSGNDWGAPPAEMLYQSFQQFASKPEPKKQRSIFKDLEQQMAQFEADHEAIVAELQKRYVLLNDPSVKGFFLTHRTAAELLIQAVPRLQEYFGAGTVFSLRTTVDEYGAQTLYAVVMWPGDVRDVRAALENFDEHWWIANSRRAAGDLTFTYELV